MQRSLFRPAIAIGLIAMALPACHPFSGHRSEPPPKPGQIITGAEIAQSHVSDAWEVLRWTGQFRMEEDRTGAPASIKVRRGQSSIYLTDADTPVIMVDGIRVNDLGELRAVGAGSIALIQILDSNAATLRYGTNSGAGAILITTKAGTPSS